jgi:hypothetical protein
MRNKLRPIVIDWEEGDQLDNLEGVSGVYSIYYHVPAPMLIDNKFGITFNPSVHSTEFFRAKNHKVGLEYNISINLEMEVELPNEPSDEELLVKSAEIADHFTQPLYIGMTGSCLKRRISQHKRDISTFISNISSYRESYKQSLNSKDNKSEFLEYVVSMYHGDSEEDKVKYKNFGRNLERFFFEQDEHFELHEHLFYFKLFKMQDCSIEKIKKIEWLLIRTFHPLTNIKYF